mgnify:FL=1
MKKGIFITFEGSEGSGKSTQSRALAAYLKSKGYNVLYLREPGATAIGEKIRRILLDKVNSSMAETTETLLYMAARAQIVKEKIIPALLRGVIVISDRFLDSTLAYQGYGLGINFKSIESIGEFACAGIKPDFTLIMDLSCSKGLSRVGKVKDRIESRALSYHERVRIGYLDLARQNQKRIKLIPVKDKESTKKQVIEAVEEFLRCHFPRYAARIGRLKL